MTDKLVYEALAEYQKEATQGWALQEVIVKLHDWAEVFRSHFKLEIPAVPLRLARLRWNCLGHFNPEFNDFGLLNEIAIDILHLLRRLMEGNWWQVLGTLLHEQLHFWQQLHGKPSKPGLYNYHNVQYRAKALATGFVVSDRGVNEGYAPDGEFLCLLKDRGVEVPEILPGPPQKQRRGRSTLKKWSCGCTNVWVGQRVLIARCHEPGCGNPFGKIDPD